MAKVNNIVEETPVEEVVTPKPARSPKKAPTKKGTVVNCSLLNVRESANTDCKVVKCIPVGTVVEITGEEGVFYKTKEGFVMKSYVEI